MMFIAILWKILKFLAVHILSLTIKAISCEFKISVEINAVISCKIWTFSGEKFFSPQSAGSCENSFQRILLIALKFFSPHSAGSREELSFNAKAVKKIFHRLEISILRIYRIERIYYTFTQIHHKFYIF